VVGPVETNQGQQNPKGPKDSYWAGASRSEETADLNSEGDASPLNSSTQFSEPRKRDTAAQTQKETSATDSDKSEPRLKETLTKKFNGLQHKLRDITQGINQEAKVG
jgi:hypothetical protein